MRSLNRSAVLGLVGCCFLITVCTKKTIEEPFGYPFVEELHLRKQPGADYSDYRAFYLLTEDFEPATRTPAEVDQIRKVLEWASTLSARYKIPWTHFVDVNTLEPALVSTDEQLKRSCQQMLADMKRMAEGGDDFELHMHGPLSAQLVEFLRSEEKLHVKMSGVEGARSYRQRRSFFFNSVYRQGYRSLVTSLIYGRSLLERSIYDGKQQVLAFRPGGWDHGGTSEDTLLYFTAIAESGLIANSGLSAGGFQTPVWRVGNYPGHNLARIRAGQSVITEVSPTSGPGGYINPLLHPDLAALAGSRGDEIVVIVSVFHLGGLQLARASAEAGEHNDEAAKQQDIEKARDALERHFQTVAELASKKVLYPVTLRELLRIVSQQD